MGLQSKLKMIALFYFPVVAPPQRPPQDANEQLRKSCDYCARMKRACDGQVPCALCCRRGKTCARSVRRKSGPAKGAKYAPRRSKVEKETAAAMEMSRGASGFKAKNRNQGTKQRGFGDTGGRERDDENGKTASRRLRQAKSQVHDNDIEDRVPPSPSESTPQPPSPPAPSASATASVEAKKHGDFPCGAEEARAGSPPRNDAEGRDASPRYKGSQRSMKKRKPVAIKVAAPSESDAAQPRKKRGFSGEDGSLAAAPEVGCDKRTRSNRPEHEDASPLSTPSASAVRPRAFPGDKSIDERPREVRAECHERRSSAAVATDEDDQSRRQQQKQPWQEELSAEAPPPSTDAPGERERSAVVVAREIDGKPLGASRIAPAEEAAPPKEDGDGSRGVARVPVTVSPTREDEGPPELPPRVRALEPSMQRGGIDAYYRKHAGLGVQSSRGMMVRFLLLWWLHANLPSFRTSLYFLSLFVG